MADYIRDIRSKVDHQPIILTFAGGILTNQNNQVLLQKRTDMNQWGLPGGALEFGETAPGACVREFREETGLTVTIKSLLGVSTNQIQHYPNGDISQSIVVEFIVELQNGNLNSNSDETLNLQYFPPIICREYLISSILIV